MSDSSARGQDAGPPDGPPGYPPSAGATAPPRWSDRARSVGFPLAAWLLVVLASLVLWFILGTEQSALRQKASESRLHGLAATLQARMAGELDELARMAARLASLPPEQRESMFSLNARQYMADKPSVVAMGLGNPRHALLKFEQSAPAAVGTGIAARFAPEFKEAFDRAERTGQPQMSAPLQLRSGEESWLIVMPMRHGGENLGYLTAAIEFRRLFARVLAAMPGNEGLRISQQGQPLYASGRIVTGDRPVTEIIPVDGQQWQVDLYPSVNAWYEGSIALVLLLGALIGGLLASALRQRELARMQMRIASASRAEVGFHVSARQSTQLALADTERRMVAVLESITDGVFMVDDQGIYTYANPRAVQLLGVAADALIGSSSGELFGPLDESPDSTNSVPSAWQAILHDRLPATLEAPLGPAKRWCEMRVFPHPLGLTVYLADISERRRYEQELRKRQAEHQHAQRLAHMGSWEYVLRSEVLHWSEETCAIFGVADSPEQEGLNALRRQVHPDDWQLLLDSQRQLYRGDGDLDVTYRIIRADGEVRTLHELGSLLPGDEPIVAGSVQDITEQRANELALRRASEELARALEATRLVMDRAPDLIVVADRDMRFLQVSAASQRLWGYAPDELVGEPIMGVVHPDDVEMTVSAVIEVMGGKPTSNFRHRNITRDGRILHMQWSAIWSEQAQCMYAVGRDHTELHHAEEMERRQRNVLNRIALRHPLAEVLDEIVLAYEAENPQAICSILLLRDGHLHHGAAPHLPRAYCEAIDGVAMGEQVGSCGTAAWRGERVFVTDIASDPLWRDYAAVALPFGLRACWSTPVLSHDGGVLGTFAVYYRSVRAPLAAEIEVLDGLVALSGVAIEHELAFTRLSESERRFRSLFDNHPDSVLTLDEEGHILDGNTMGRLHFSLGVAAGPQSFVDRFDAPHRPRIKSSLEDAARGEPRRLDAALTGADGSPFPVHLVMIPIVHDENVRQLFAIVQDQRELRRVQQDIVRQLARLSAIATSVDEGLVAVNMALQPTFLNATAMRLLDAPADALPIEVALPEGMFAPMREVVAGSLRTASEDAVFTLASGRQLDVSYIATPKIIDGRMAGVVLAFRDIAEVKATRRVLQQRNRFFEMAQEMFCIVDPARGQIVQVNPAFARLMGYDEMALLQMPYAALIHPQDQADAERIIEQQLRGAGQLARPTLRMRRADGNYRLMEWNASTGLDGLLYAAARDVTARHASDQALARAMGDLRDRNRELQDFAYVASHDLQEPLRKIQTFSDRLLSRRTTELDESARDYLRRMGAAAQRMQALIDDLLTYSRSGSSAAALMAVDLAGVMATVLDDLEQRISEADAVIDVSPLPTIHADATQMHQLLQNLLANALKFRAAERPCRISVRARSIDTDGPDATPRCWELRVEDNGIGFEPGYAERIFVPFQRLHPRNVYPGTGIGLAIVRRIVERHGGTVRAESIAGQGATFVVTLLSRPTRFRAVADGERSFTDGQSSQGEPR